MRKATLLGAIAGDVIGSAYEFSPNKCYDFELLTPHQNYTDDSLMTIAVADWLMSSHERNTDDLVRIMQRMGRKYASPCGGYGPSFARWIQSKNPQPYNSWGNGSAMRVSACGFAYDTLEETLAAARDSAIVTHNHPEGVKGAQATAAVIFLARNGKSKEEIREYVSDTFSYDLNRTCDEIRPRYTFDVSCMGTVPEAIIAFLESKDYEDALRLTISLGGDADTLGAITGAMAIAYYGEMSDEIYDYAISKLPKDLLEIVERFDKLYHL